MLFKTNSKDEAAKSNNNQRQHQYSTTVKNLRHASTSRGHSTQSVRNAFLAGLTAGVVGTLVGHPLDSAKVWAQTGKKPDAAQASWKNVTVKDLLGILRRSYAGVMGPLFTVGLIQSINFTVYDSMRRFLYYNIENPDADPAQREYLEHDSFASLALSGLVAGLACSLVTQPVVMIKTKQQTLNMSFSEALRHSMRKPLVGYAAHVYFETGNRSLYFVVYEGLKRRYRNSDDGSTSMTTRLMSAATAGIVSFVPIYPGDVICNRLYAESAVTCGGSSQRSSSSIPQIVRQMYAEQGLKAFFQGVTVATLRAGPVAAAIFPVYDIVLDWLNKLDF